MSADQIRTGPPTAVVVDEDENLVFYLGQPGIDNDIPAIERGEPPDYGFVRLKVPMALVDAPHTIFDLSEQSSVEYTEHFRRAPGCAGSQEAVPWTGAWTAGTPGLSGIVEVVADDDGYDVAYFFSYRGVFETPCGSSRGRHRSKNQFHAVVQ